MAKEHKITLRGLRRPLMRKVPVRIGGRMAFDYVPDGHETFSVVVMVDMEALGRQLATRAAKSKKRKATAMHGAVTVAVVRAQRGS